jgi:hypothetical protein
MNAPVEQQPLVKAAQAAELARSGARVNAMLTQVLEECGYIGFNGRKQNTVALLKEFCEGAQIAEIGLTGEWTQAFFHAQIRLVVLEKREIAGAVHTFNYPCLRGALARAQQFIEPLLSTNQHRQ